MTVINVNQDNTEFNVRNVETEITIQSIGLKGVDGVGVPAGGGTGQVLAKNSSTDYDTEWVDVVPDAVSSVNGQTGVVVLDAADVGADSVGSASQALQDANDYTDGKVSGLDAELATVAKTGSYNDLDDKPTIPTVPVQSVNGRTGNVTGLAEASDVAAQLNTKVDKVAGKGLSTEDYTTAEKTKLAGVETGAQVNTVTSVAGKTGAVTLAKGDVGLSDVDNTSDLNKPISTATQTALDGKATRLNIGQFQMPVRNASGSGEVDGGITLTENAVASTVMFRTTGGRTNVGTPMQDANATTKLYVDTADALKVNKAGDTMTGPLGTSINSLSYNHTRASETWQWGATANSTFGIWNNSDSAYKFEVSRSRVTLNGLPIINGTGFPNGVISAPVGSIYIDTAVTNGASSWIKKSGTGNTGWQVLEGDTGWRDIISLVNATYISTTPAFNSYLHIRIKDGIVFMRGRIIVTAAIGGSETQILTGSSGVPAEYRASANVPAGFVGMVSTADLNTITMKLIRDCIISNGNFGTINLPLGGQYSFSTSWANTGGWPSTLPGTAV